MKKIFEIVAIAGYEIEANNLEDAIQIAKGECALEILHEGIERFIFENNSSELDPKDDKEVD